MRVLTFTTLYPNEARPGHALPVETRLRHVVATGEVESRVVAPVPWFPSRHAAFGDYALHARTPREEVRHGIRVLHPRYPLLPKIGMTAAPFMLAQAMKPVFARLLKERPFDLIDAHYFYPDGVAAVMLGRHFDKPVVITARGTDLNLIAQYRVPRLMIQWAAAHAAGLVTVCSALKDRLVSLGVPAGRIKVLRNGVDLERFRPVDRPSLRQRLGFTGITLLSVGNLLPLKGHDIAIRALTLLPQCNLVIAGHGPEYMALADLARELGVAHRVTFAGGLSQDDLRQYYGAADALVLASSREGWPNVLLESLACGTPVVSRKVGGTPEVITSPAAGILFDERTPEALASAVTRLIEQGLDRAEVRRYAEQYSWDATTEGQLELFSRVLAEPRVQPELRIVAGA
jgi:glycosyltransferase involved in cell wall biosynthesis